MVNQALLNMSGIPSAELIVGKYNILRDPTVLFLNGVHRS